MLKRSLEDCSNRGHSSHEHNPFIALKRKTTDENQGEAIGISLVYSGNFKIQAEVDTRNTARILAGINPDTFDWKLDAGEHFQRSHDTLFLGIGDPTRADVAIDCVTVAAAVLFLLRIWHRALCLSHHAAEPLLSAGQGYWP